MDAGVHPKREGRSSLPLFDLVKGEELDAIAITHCHHDHVGSLPLAVRQHPHAHVLMTELSYFLVERVLHNSVNVMERQRTELGIREYPLYTHGEVDDIAPLFQGFKYNREIEWAGFRKGRSVRASPTLEFFDAGHALGSAGILVRGRRETLFYTGDVCFHDQTILKAARFHGVRADVLVMETTRGNRAPTPGFQREAEVGRLIAAIRETLKRKGSVLIPAFALGRTQEILAELALAMRAGKLKPQPIFIGGLGRVFTEIYDLEGRRANRRHPRLSLNEALQLVVLEKGQAENMRLTNGRIFVVTAGMMSENTPAHELAARMVGDKRHGIFFVGYADPDAPGGRLKASAVDERFFFSTDAGEVTRQCELRDFDLSAHAHRDQLLDFVSEVDPRTVVLGHGDASARAWFAEQIAVRHPKMRVIQPSPGQWMEP
jgi:Cft2 family RNA processing exonuclease